MRYFLLQLLLFVLLPVTADAQCSRFPPANSTAFNAGTNSITLPWRIDYPASVTPQTHAWESVGDLAQNWQGYMAAVIGEVKAAGLTLANKKINLPPGAPWWIAPWMDFGASGREPLQGLTKERGPDPNDLAPGSSRGHQVWAIGWYNAEGAFGLGKVFADPCNPKIPAPSGGAPWTFPNKTASFKLLFTDAPPSAIPYLAGSPVVEAMIGPPGGGSGARVKREVRLLQVDIGVRDTNATDTQWVMGTFVWKGPATGDGFFDNLVPVGLMWGNDPGKENPVWAQFAPIQESRLNPALAGLVWQGGGVTWPQRPYPGFQGRLNGPADNLRSSCLSCHALAQWRRHKVLELTPTYKLDPPPTPSQVTKVVADYFRNVRGGTLTDPTADPTTTSISLDYSLQLEAGFTRMCAACDRGKLAGATPDLCKMAGRGQINRDTCEQSTIPHLISAARRAVTGLFSSSVDEVDLPPRQ